MIISDRKLFKFVNRFLQLELQPGSYEPFFDGVLYNHILDGFYEGKTPFHLVTFDCEGKNREREENFRYLREVATGLGVKLPSFFDPVVLSRGNANNIHQKLLKFFYVYKKRYLPDVVYDAGKRFEECTKISQAMMEERNENKERDDSGEAIEENSNAASGQVFRKVFRALNLKGDGLLGVQQIQKFLWQQGAHASVQNLLSNASGGDEKLTEDKFVEFMQLHLKEERKKDLYDLHTYRSVHGMILSNEDEKALKRLQIQKYVKEHKRKKRKLQKLKRLERLSKPIDREKILEKHQTSYSFSPSILRTVPPESSLPASKLPILKPKPKAKKKTPYKSRQKFKEYSNEKSKKPAGKRRHSSHYVPKLLKCKLCGVKVRIQERSDHICQLEQRTKPKGRKSLPGTESRNQLDMTYSPLSYYEGVSNYQDLLQTKPRSQISYHIIKPKDSLHHASKTTPIFSPKHSPQFTPKPPSKQNRTPNFHRHFADLSPYTEHPFDSKQLFANESMDHTSELSLSDSDNDINHWKTR